MRGFHWLPFLAAMVVLCCAAADTKPPAQFKSEGSFSGGSAVSGTIVSGVRFGAYPEYTRMVLDLQQTETGGKLIEAVAHPQYMVEYRNFPYRVVIRMPGAAFKLDAPVQSKPALPFSVVASPGGGELREVQVFLPGPSDFKVIEIDDPAKICIDIRPRQEQVPTVYTVQVLDADTAERAYAMSDSGKWPPGFSPQVLVLGSTVVLEQAFTDPVDAASCDEALRAMGYRSVINERRGNELPLR
jgi:hypothetical protein